MIIESIELENFRNYKSLHMEFETGTNILYGDNAQGKTNILEAVYLCGTTKSHKGSKDKEIIRFHKDESHIRMKLKKNMSSYKIDMHLKKNKTKGIAINGIPIKKASELFGIINIVFFSPEDLNLIKNGPSERRKFIDSELCQLDKLYLFNLANYNKVVNQRNKLLKDISFNPEYISTLEVWDEQMVKYGKKIIQSRKDFIDKLNIIIFDIHKKLSGEKEEIELIYEPNVLEDDFKIQLLKNREKDIKLKTTSVGPHRDDLRFNIKGIDIRKYGSQGQQRTAALSLKLAEIEIVKRQVKETPILLLDDVLSELDSNRQNYLLNSIHDIQTFITCTGLDEFVSNRFKINKVFRIVEGAAFIGGIK
jgi:DNA replication and repair protein RecF